MLSVPNIGEPSTTGEGMLVVIARLLMTDVIVSPPALRYLANSPELRSPAVFMHLSLLPDQLDTRTATA